MTQAAGRLTRWQVVAAGALGLFVMATNRWLGAGVTHPWSADVIAYTKLADAAPHLPTGPRLPNAYTERVTFHWLIGMFSHATGIGLHTSYHIAAALCTFLLIFVAAWILASAGVSRWAWAVGLAAFVLAAYSDIREVIQTPGGVQDLIFVIGVGLLLLGLIKINLKLLLGGVLIAILARQNTLLVAPTAAAWTLVDPRWRPVPARPRFAAAAGVLATCALPYIALKLIVAPITKPFAPQSLKDTIFFSPFSPGPLASHLARCLDPLVVTAPLLAALLVLLLRRGVRLRELPPTLWLSVSMAAVIVAEPMLIRPDFPGFMTNEQRLAGFGLLPLCLALTVAIEEAWRRGALAPPSKRVLTAVGALLAVGSLHHVFTLVGPSSLAQFVVLQIGAALGLLVLLNRLAGRRRLA